MLSKQENSSPKNKTIEEILDKSELKEKKDCKKFLPKLQIEEGNNKAINQRRILKPSKTQNSM
jgi:hypothetical protein